MDAFARARANGRAFIMQAKATAILLVARHLNSSLTLNCSGLRARERSSDRFIHPFMRIPIEPTKCVVRRRARIHTHAYTHSLKLISGDLAQDIDATQWTWRGMIYPAVVPIGSNGGPRRRSQPSANPRGSYLLALRVSDKDGSISLGPGARPSRDRTNPPS